MDQQIINQIIDYIKKARSLGLRDVDTHQRLLDQKWPEQETTRAFNELDQSQNKYNQPTQKEIITVSPEASNVKKIIFYCLFVLVVLGVIGFGLYYYITRNSAPTGENIKNESTGNTETFNNAVLVKTNLTHKTSLKELGITFPLEKGNSADIYMVMVGTNEKPGIWSQKYKGKTSGEIYLDQNDINLLLQMASKEKFSLYPEYFALPSSPIDAGLQTPPLPVIRDVGKIAILTAQQMEMKGKKAEAEQLLKSLVVIGRQIEDSEFCPTIQWLVGLSIETSASEALKTFYQENNNMAEADLFNDYLTEIGNLRTAITSWSKEFTRNLFVATGFFMAQDQVSPRIFLNDVYDRLDTNETIFRSWLDSLKNINSPIIQMETLSALLLIKNANGLEPERITAEDVLKQYTKSKNIYVADYSQKILDFPREQVSKWVDEIKKATAETDMQTSK